MRLVVEERHALSFPDGSPVRAASAVVPFGGGWLVVQDDATHAAWLRAGTIEPVRVVAAIDGLEVFSEVAGTKHLKPDFEAACTVTVDGAEAAFLLGSGSSPARMRASLLRLDADGSPYFVVADLTPAYRAVASAMGLADDQLNLEGACVVGDRLRWFQRANVAVGAPSVCADVELAALLTATAGPGDSAAGPGGSAAGSAGSAADPGGFAAGPAGERDPARFAAGPVRHYDLGRVRGVALAITDAVPVAEGLILVSAVAEDTPNAIDDGPVVAAALALLDDFGVRAIAELPGAPKVEGLALIESAGDGARVMAVVDADDPAAPSERLTLRVTL
ncbi:hypothetical protein ODJ79_21100 [Actinoplanes sp. KI2]|uniref:DUF6910 family protein n=1 Tax=Actinoplanes sp. KI2 TaxID=2983315 RepID=UPI0021D5A2A4|nr:hypothetical protein [Actinoplanes sp. KI2]MCU7726233.1 hypothetical protein [Actinoplanes sp. KI2]